jgi:hypothetical protein
MMTWSLASLVLPGSEEVEDRPADVHFLAVTAIVVALGVAGCVMPDVVWLRPRASR